MSTEVVVGFVLWAILLYPVWSPRCRKIRAAKNTIQPVSRNGVNRSGVDWVQDEPYPECFEEDDL